MTAIPTTETPARPLPINPASIELLVNRFYSRIRENFSLGPIFEAAILEDGWDAHLAKMCDFWETLLLGATRYKGQPVVAHRRLPGLEACHFQVWLQLFDRTTREIFAPADADRIQIMAERMARGMTASLFRNHSP